MNINQFRKLEPSQINRNTFSLILDDWFLLSAGELTSFNTMTASWGGFGILWNKPVVFCFVRPQRFTYQFIESAETFTLSFFNENHREALRYCGKVSGKQFDKMKATGLKPFLSPSGSIFYEQAELLIECRKLYFSDLDPTNFIHPAISENYPKKDFHRMYIGEILSVYETL